MKLWEAAVNEAGSLKQDDVIEASTMPRSPRGPAFQLKWCLVSITFV